jgi:N utilization substance protein B
MSKPREPETPGVTPRRAHGGRRHRARLAAVQALYQMHLTQATAGDVLAEFERHRFGVDTEHAADGEGVERAFFAALVREAGARLPELDALIGASLAEDWTLERLEIVLLAVLRCGACELLSRRDVPPRVTINEYVDIAHSFLDGKGPAMVNAVLDRVARQVRGTELQANTAGTSE